MTFSDSPQHFKGKDAIGHVIEAQAEGLASSAEMHGVEVPGQYSAGADAARETALIMTLLWVMFTYAWPLRDPLFAFSVFALAWSFWKTGRSAWLGWSRLERLHRILEQERWEIMHHRPQEREELKVLYQAKGFEGKLLEDVLDVLMADDNRLLRVMVEEELGLTLESQEHPLKQAVGAFFGSMGASLICLLGFYLYPTEGLIIAAGITISIASALSAYFAQNKIISAIVWNLGITAVAFATLYFMLQYL